MIPAATGLPDTGANVTAPLVLGLILLTGGTTVLILLRRKVNR
ncbi:LPXTG cell wall anchor domain-containing protein [Actinosynnema sp. CA-248983]